MKATARNPSDPGLRAKPMRIAFFVNRFPAISEVFIVNAAAGLIDAGHSVDIYALHGDGVAGQAMHERVSRYGMDTQARIFRMRGRPRRRMALAPLAGLKLAASGGASPVRALQQSHFGKDAPRLVSLHEAAMFRHGGRYDILHCHFATLAEPVLRHRRAGFLSGKVVVHFRGYDISQVIQEYGPAVFERTFADADGFIANCGYFRDRVARLGAPQDRTAVIPSPVDAEAFKPRVRNWSPGQSLNLLGVGRLVEKKGFRFAIEAVATLVARGIDARLTLVGDGPLRGDLQALTEKLNLTSRVEFVGAETHERIAHRLTAAHIFIAPSTTASNGDQDASINTLKEAMAAACPCVTTSHGGIPELADGLAGVVMAPEADSRALADGVDHLLTLRDKWEQLGAVSRARIVDSYSIDAVTRQTLAFYAGLPRDKWSMTTLRETTNVA
jgi:colanic acid/amylovoran biosynthesis glycosyltransferase